MKLIVIAFDEKSDRILCNTFGNITHLQQPVFCTQCFISLAYIRTIKELKGPELVGKTIIIPDDTQIYFPEFLPSRMEIL